PPPPPPGTLFSDDFSQQFPPDQGLDTHWSLDLGSWYSDGRAVTDASGGDQASENVANCGDCSARASVIGFGVPEVGVFVRGGGLWTSSAGVVFDDFALTAP